MSALETTESHESIARTNENFMRTYKAGDRPGMAGFYTKDAQILPPNENIVTGEEAIRDFYKDMMDMGIKEVVLRTIEFEPIGETAVEVADYKLYGEGSAELDYGKCIIIWKKEHGEWKMHRDMYNSSLPVQG